MQQNFQRLIASDFLQFGGTGLHILPSYHWRIEFAAVVLRGSLESFDRIYIELPSNLHVAEVLEALRRMDGDTGGLLVPQKGPVRAPVPRFAGDRRGPFRPLYFSALLPVVHDSMMTTLRALVHIPAHKRPQIRFIDAPFVAGEQPHEARVRDGVRADAQEVSERGLQGWYSRWEQHFRSLKPAAEDHVRELHMAHQLTDVLRPGVGRTLFICGAAHWPRLADLLHAPDKLAPIPQLAPLDKVSVFTAAIDPGILHSWGLADLPFIAGEFERGHRIGNHHFNRDACIRAMLGEAYASGGHAAPTRGLLNLEAFAQRMKTSAGRWSCDLDQHLLPAATAAVGATFAHEIELAAMHYPFQPGRFIPRAGIVPGPDGSFYIVNPDEAHLVKIGEPPEDDAPKRKRPMRVSQPESMPQSEDSGWSLFGNLMKAPSEERLGKHLSNHARWLAHQLIPTKRIYVARKFNGSLGAGMDHRRTIRARARGESTLYIRKRLRDPEAHHRCDNCPVVWIFDSRATIREKVGDYVPATKDTRQQYTCFYWFTDRHVIRDHVKRRTIACYARLCRNSTPNWAKEVLIREIVHRTPPDKACHTTPWDDDIGDRFTGPDLAIAAAIKWAQTDHLVIANCDPAYRPSAAVRDYARTREIRILEPAPSFDPLQLRRYQTDTEVPLKEEWAKPSPTDLQLIEPVPGFDNPDDC